MNRTQDWLEQAKHDLAHARQSIDLEHFAWSCFAAQQAAEKPVKALHLHLGTVAWGHSVFELLDGLPSDLHPQIELLERAKILDRFYIPLRYASAHPAGPSYRYYVRADAEQAVVAAQEVIEYRERHILQTGQGAKWTCFPTPSPKHDVCSARV
jgi:HEPN domain-containing protein